MPVWVPGLQVSVQVSYENKWQIYEAPKPSPFPVHMSSKVTKPGFSFCYFVL